MHVIEVDPDDAEARGFYWFTSPPAPGDCDIPPEWMRSAAILPDGHIYLTAFLMGIPDALAASVAMACGENILVHDGHLYLRSGFIADFTPHARETIAIVEDRVTQAYALRDHCTVDRQPGQG